MTESKRDIIRYLLQEYDIKSAKDIQDALKDLLGGTIKEMMENEMDEHLGYKKSHRSVSSDSRNGYKEKHVNSSFGDFSIDVPQDRESSFEPKHSKKTAERYLRDRPENNINVRQGHDNKADIGHSPRYLWF